MQILKKQLGGGLFNRIKQSPLLITLGIFLLLLSIIGMSFAIWYYTDYQKTENIVTLDCFYVTMNETTGTNIKLQNAFPLTNDEGEKLTPYEFTITNHCPGYASYEVQLEVRESSTLDSDFLRIKYNDDLSDLLPNYPESANLIEKDTNEGYILDTGYLGPEESKINHLRIWLDEEVTTETLNEDQSKVQNSSWAGVITLRASYTTVASPPTLIDTILALPKATEGNGLYEVDHNNVSETELGSEWKETPEYRYAGIDPDNYVTFNEEVAGWRIIGLVNVKTSRGKIEQRVKLIRKDSIGDYSWDTSTNEINSGYGVNEWSKSDLKTLLNDYYYNDYGINNNHKCSVEINNTDIDCNFNNNGLKEETKIMIDENIIWNTGTNDGETYTYNNISVAPFYMLERSSNIGKICTHGNYCNDEVDRTTEWSKESDSVYHGIGLMYPSDYGYATSGSQTGTAREQCLAKEIYDWKSDSWKTDCAENDWLKPTSKYYWTISSYSDSSYAHNVFTVSSSGSVRNSIAYNSHAVLPVVYLHSDVLVSNGVGSKEEPFVLSIP